NDINGFHVKPEHVLSALEGAKAAVVPVEGNVGGGTGMVCHGFKGGIGTASRKLDARDGGYTVGVLVQCNCCARRELRVAGVPVGQEIPDLLPCLATTDASIRAAGPRCDAAPATRTSQGNEDDGQGSIIVVDATAQATEEAMVNAMLQAETMTGANYARVYALPIDRLMAAMKKYGR